VGQQRLTLEPAVVSNYVEALHNFGDHVDTISIAAEVTVRYRAARGELVMIPIRDRVWTRGHIESADAGRAHVADGGAAVPGILCGRLG